MSPTIAKNAIGDGEPAARRWLRQIRGFVNFVARPATRPDAPRGGSSRDLTTPPHARTNGLMDARNVMDLMDPQLEGLKFDANGLIPAIVQDWKTGQVLMMAWMNRDSLAKT